MGNTTKTGAKSQHHLSVANSAPKIPFCETPEFNSKDYIKFWWHKGDPKLIAEHEAVCRQNVVLRTLECVKQDVVEINKLLRSASQKDKRVIEQKLHEGIKLINFVLRKIETKLVEVSA